MYLFGWINKQVKLTTIPSKCHEGISRVLALRRRGRRNLEEWEQSRDERLEEERLHFSGKDKVTPEGPAWTFYTRHAVSDTAPEPPRPCLFLTAPSSDWAWWDARAGPFLPDTGPLKVSCFSTGPPHCPGRNRLAVHCCLGALLPNLLPPPPLFSSVSSFFLLQLFPFMGIFPDKCLGHLSLCNKLLPN